MPEPVLDECALGTGGANALPDSKRSKRMAGENRRFLLHCYPGTPSRGSTRSAFATPASPTETTLAQTSPCLVLANSDGNRQARASLWPRGTVDAIPATRMNAVAPTATAPMIEKTTCQISDGMVCCTMP